LKTFNIIIEKHEFVNGFKYFFDGSVKKILILKKEEMANTNESHTPP